MLRAYALQHTFRARFFDFGDFAAGAQELSGAGSGRAEVRNPPRRDLPDGEGGPDSA